ncbi:unnamed protein product, partial [Rhizoctonia solani]
TPHHSGLICSARVKTHAVATLYHVNQVQQTTRVDLWANSIRDRSNSFWNDSKDARCAGCMPIPGRHVEFSVVYWWVFVFGINDVYDYETDIRNPRKSATSLEGTILPPAHHDFVYRAAITASIMTIATSMLPSTFASTASSSSGTFQAYAPVLTTTALVALGWLYSAPPARFKEVPIIDSLSNGLIVFLSWFLGYASCRALAGDRGLGWNISDIPSKGYVLGLVTSSVHALGAAADIDADLAAGQRTVGTVLGSRGCAVLGVVAYGLALLTEPLASIFGVYLIGGLGLMLSVCAVPTPTWVHHAFKVIVFWTVVMSFLWFGAKLSKRTT